MSLSDHHVKTEAPPLSPGSQDTQLSSSEISSIVHLLASPVTSTAPGTARRSSNRHRQRSPFDHVWAAHIEEAFQRSSQHGKCSTPLYHDEEDRGQTPMFGRPWVLEIISVVDHLLASADQPATNQLHWPDIEQHPRFDMAWAEAIEEAFRRGGQSGQLYTPLHQENYHHERREKVRESRFKCLHTIDRLFGVDAPGGPPMSAGVPVVSHGQSLTSSMLSFSFMSA